jgi:hypothetical protein
MHHNQGLFRCNGRSGLVPKPPELCSRHHHFSPNERITYKSSPKTLEVSVCVLGAPITCDCNHFAHACVLLFFPSV